MCNVYLNASSKMFNLFLTKEMYFAIKERIKNLKRKVRCSNFCKKKIIKNVRSGNLKKKNLNLESIFNFFFLLDKTLTKQKNN